MVFLSLEQPDAKMDVAGTDCAPCKMANIVANVRPGGPAEIAAYDSNWNVMITLTMTKVSPQVTRH